MVWLESLFPGLRDIAWCLTSPSDADYNCIAWAAGDRTKFWWPVGESANPRRYWPPGVACEVTLSAFVAAFGTLGYVPTDAETLEPQFEKVALFVNDDGEPTHAALQLSDGNWTSKLARSEDIEHPLHALEGEIYGRVVQILKRPLRT